MALFDDRHFSITSDYVTSYGDPQPYLARIAEAGFSHVHWCHHWDTDFLYSSAEIAQIARWLKGYGLQALNIHASQGREKRWDSALDYERLAGLELVRNRLEMAAWLEADVIILHAEAYCPLEAQRRSLAALEPFSRSLGVRIALENLNELTFQRLEALLAEFPPDYVGLCYDTGHGNLIPQGLDHLERFADRLIAVHIHDNDGTGDEHKLPFYGTVDWERFMRLLRRSPYAKPLNLEVGVGKHPELSEADFLQAALQAGKRLAELGRL